LLRFLIPIRFFVVLPDPGAFVGTLLVHFGIIFSCTNIFFFPVHPLFYFEVVLFLEG
tara:strand:- start:691 stop:861 length:171 start_codon:yes stop_codon:yes gene_type:complete